jgi:hypothetical protein
LCISFFPLSTSAFSYQSSFFLSLSPFLPLFSIRPFYICS